MGKPFRNLFHQRRALLRISNLWLNDPLNLVRVGIVAELCLPDLGWHAEMGTHHGYAFSDRGNLHEAAREKHYERMLALYRRYIS